MQDNKYGIKKAKAKKNKKVTKIKEFRVGDKVMVTGRIYDHDI